MPASAGIQAPVRKMDSHLRGNDSRLLLSGILYPRPNFGRPARIALSEPTWALATLAFQPALPEATFQPGCMVAFDIGLVYNGYRSDFERSVIVFATYGWEELVGR